MLRPKLLLKLFTPNHNFSESIEPPSIKTPTKNTKKQAWRRMNQNHMMTTYHAYLIDFSVPLSSTLAPTKSPYQLSTFCILSKQKLFVPEFVIDRRKDVIKTVKLLPMGTVVRFGLCVCVTDVILHVHNTKTCKFTKLLFSFTIDCYDVSQYVFG